MEINPRYKNINILNFLNDIEMVPLSKETYFIHLIHFTHFFFPLARQGHSLNNYVKTKDCSASIDSYLKTYEINVMEICHKPRHKLKVCKTHKRVMSPFFTKKLIAHPTV